MGLFSKKEPEATVIRGAGKELACLVCGHDRFHARAAMLNTPGLTFLDLEWANKTAQCQVCARCGYIHWFLD